MDEGTPLTLDGSGSSDPNGDALSFAWDLDDDGNYDDSTAGQPAYTWNDNGTHTVALKVSDSLLDDTDTATVTVNDLSPTAEFTWAPEPQAEGVAVSFTDASTSYPDTITGWDWDFGGLGTSSDQHPSFTFNDNGTYTVTLTVKDEDGSTSSVSHDVTITDKAPVANVTGDTPIDEGTAGTYDATGSTSSPDAIVRYEWDWNYDGATFNPSGDTGTTQSHAWIDNGTYIVAVRVTDDDGNTDIATLNLVVSNVPPIVDAGADQTVNEGDTVNLDPATFTDKGSTDTHIAVIVWSEGTTEPGIVAESEGTGTVSGSHVYADADTYTVTVTVTDNDGSIGSDTLTVKVESSVEAEQTIFDLAARAKSGKVQLTWSQVAGVECYNVYRSETSGGPYSKIADCHVTTYCTYLDYNVVNGTTYYYVVRSVVNGIESLDSNEISATPQARSR